MKFVFRILYLVIILIIVKSYTAQQYSFYNFNEENGLSKNTVLGVNQNSRGEILLGTYNGGLDIINGAEINNISKNEGLIDNYVYDIVSLSNYRQLITTNNGVNILNKGKLFSYFFKDSLTSTLVYTGFEGVDNLIWLATGKGLAFIEGETIVSYETKSEGLNNTPVIHIRKGKNGAIWCATMGSGVFLLKADNSVVHYKLEDKLEYTFQTFQYDDSTTWFLTYKGIFELKGGVVSEVKIQCNQSFSGVYYHSCIRDSKGNIWIATLYGVIKIDKNGNQKLFTIENGLAGNDSWKIFEDNEGNIWISFKSAGLSKLTNESLILINKKLTSVDVKAIFIDSLHRTWLGTKKGVNFFFNDTVINYSIGYETQDEIKSIIYLNGKFYFLSKDGLNVLNNDKITNYNVSGSERFAGQCLFVSDNRIFLGSSVQGLAEFKNNEIVYINDSIGMDRIGIFAINKTKDNNWWYATENGLFRHNGKELTKISAADGLPSGKTRSLVLDQQGKLWVGNSEGIFYKEGNKFHAVYKNDTTHNNSIYSLCFDKEGNLWAGKIDGIDKISITNGMVGSIRRFEPNKGYDIGSLHNNAIALDSNGHILVGTDRGLLEINPYLDFPNTVESITHIEDIRLFSQTTDWSKYADSLDVNGFPIGLALAYNQNYFTFDYIGICHKYPQGVRYQTKLEGLDKEWVDRDDKRFVIYGNLEPGTYTFLLKSCNNEGIWNKEPVHFSFIIRHPFWQTWWFYSICIGIVFAGIWSYVKIRNANIQITHKNEQITLKNHEIEEKSKEIMDSINYAKRIQDSILPDSKMKHLIPQSFVYFQPKDVVSGDFYWLKRIEDELIFGAIDCTGHGVPGAFVSMVGFGGLNRAVNEYKLVQPNLILEKLSDFVVDSFAKHESKSINDGMDASLCALNRKTNVLQYAGANNSIYIIRETKNPLVNPAGIPIEVKNLDTLNEIKATRRPIGKVDNPVPFEMHTIQLEKGDTVYLYTDGFPDQFGGVKGKKYMYKTFKRFLVSIQDLPIEKQGDRLKEEYNKWALGHEQVDDICIIGIKI